MRLFRILVGGAAMALVPGGALAETLTVAGIYPAGEDAPSEVNEIAISEFSGRAGERLAFAIEDRLRSVVIQGEPWFAVTLNGQGGDVFIIREGDPDSGRRTTVERSGPEALLRGAVNVEVGDTDSGTKEVKRCAERDASNKCVREVVDTYKCRDRNVTLRPDLRLAARDGRTLFSARDTRTATQRFCEDEREAPSIDAMIEGLVDSYANEIRYIFAPVQREEGIRVLETRKGMSRTDSTAFRNAVRLTTNDAYGACLAFEQLEASNPAHVSVLFNIGLCHESNGDLETAERYYNRTLAIEPGKDYAESGLDRIAARRRAEQQLELHFGGQGEE